MQTKSPFFDEKKIDKFLDEFQKETPRAAAILGVAYLDHLLNELLKSKLVKNETIFKSFIDRLTFEQRVILCYLIGIISIKERDDLRRINKIRGHFAHDFNLNSFDEKDTPAECDKLYLPQVLQKRTKFLAFDTPRSKYTITVVMLMMMLQIRLLGSKRFDECKPWNI